MRISGTTINHWVRLTFFYFLLVAIFGMLLRYAFINPGGFVFQFFKHTHSHVAFLGWVFNALFVLIVYAYFNEISAKIRWQFYLFQLSIMGMLFTFPFQGYAAASIAFSTLHVIISIWFYFSTIAAIEGDDPSIKWIKLAAFYMAVSNLGPLSLAPILISNLKDSFVYHLSLQHYLHFQYNGWFIVGAIGLFLKYFDLNILRERLLFWLLGWSVIPLFFITIEMIQPNPVYRVIGSLGALAQLIGVFMLLNQVVRSLRFKKLAMQIILGIALLALAIKSLFQLSVVFPDLSSVLENHNAIIGFLHLIFLGIISNLLLLLFIKTGFIKPGRLALSAVIFFNVGFMAMETLLFIQPFYVPTNYFQWLFYSSLPILLGVIIFNITSWNRKTKGDPL